MGRGYNAARGLIYFKGQCRIPLVAVKPDITPPAIKRKTNVPKRCKDGVIKYDF